MWQKEFGGVNGSADTYAAAAIVVLVIIGFLFKKPLLFLLIGLLAAYLLVNKYYNKQIGKKLKIINQPDVIRLFPGDKSVLEFELQNQSILPIVNGKFQFQTDLTIKAMKYAEKTNKYWNQFQIPLTVTGKGNIHISLPIQAEKRGVARVRNIVYQFPHLFNFDYVKLTYTDYFKLEYVVYPKPLPVKGMDRLSSEAPGNQHASYSLYEDSQNIRGVRNYTHGDPFSRINWKASAKTQEFQTNVLEKVLDRGYLLLVNIGTSYGGQGRIERSPHLEDLISCTAFVCQYMQTNGYPYELAVNARKPGKIPFVTTNEGEGKSHYVRTLDLLARIHPQSMLVPFPALLHHTKKKLYRTRIIVIIGEVSKDDLKILTELKKTQKQIYQIIMTEDGPVMKSWAGDVTAYAE